MGGGVPAAGEPWADDMPSSSSIGMGEEGGELMAIREEEVEKSQPRREGWGSLAVRRAAKERNPHPRALRWRKRVERDAEEEEGGERRKGERERERGEEGGGG